MNWVLIMAGGAGTRFWPASRLERPKQVLKVNSSKPLIRETVDRVLSVVPKNRILVLTQKRQFSAIKKALPGIPSKNFIIEPVGRNTAPALGLGALTAFRRDPQAVVACLPSDQIIRDKNKFVKVLRTGIETAKAGTVHVTFGIPPRSPETGFGYIERGAAAGKKSGIPVFNVKRFVEKPDFKTAQKYVKSGRFFWNAGIFVWNAKFLISELKKYQPEIYGKLQKIRNEKDLRKIYPSIAAISIDYAVMEKAKNVRVIPGDFGWSDIGSWSAFETIWKKDPAKNAVRGKVVTVDSTGNIVDGDSKLVALVGVRDLVVVSTEDAILVSRKDKVQDVRKVIDILRKQKQEKYL